MVAEGNVIIGDHSGQPSHRKECNGAGPEAVDEGVPPSLYLILRLHARWRRPSWPSLSVPSLPASLSAAADAAAAATAGALSSRPGPAARGRRKVLPTLERGCGGIGA